MTYQTKCRTNGSNFEALEMSKTAREEFVCDLNMIQCVVRKLSFGGEAPPPPPPTG